MAKYIFTNIIGSFVFNENFNLVDKAVFEDNNKEEIENKLKAKHNAVGPSTGQLKAILEFFKKKEFFTDFYKINLFLTKKQIKASVSNDLLIMQTIACIEDIDRVANTLIKRLREWYAFYNPEFTNKLSNNEKFTELIMEKSKKDLLKEINLTEEVSMGAELSKQDVDQILYLAGQAKNLYMLRQQYEKYLELLMKKECPNLLEVAGTTIGAKLIEKAGGLRRLSQFPASTVQLLGAEKALFRHMMTGARAPKFGILYQHPLIQKVDKKSYGKVARALADKISIAVKVDYFKGNLIGDKLKKDLEDRFKKF